MSSISINILHINTNDLKGGAAKVALRLAEEQRDLGHDVKMLVGRKESNSIYSFPFSIDPDINNFHYCQESGLLDYHLQGSFKLLDNPLLKEADIIHFHNLHGNFFNPFAISAISNLKPVVWTLHDMQAVTGHCSHSLECPRWETGCGNCPSLEIYPSIKVDSTQQLWEDKLTIYNHSTLKVVSPSLWLKNIAERGLFNKNEVELIYNGVDTEVFKPIRNNHVRSEFNINNDTIVIGCVANGGSLENKLKGGYYIKQAIDELKSKGLNFIFLNIGSNASFHSEESIINTGYIYDEHQLAEIYSALDIFLFPTIADNCPLVVLEALACEIPIVTFETGGVPELVRHNHNGLVAEHKNTHMLISYLLELSLNKELREKYSRNTRIDVMNKYDHKIITKQYQILYNQTIHHFQNNKEMKHFNLSQIPELIKNNKMFLNAERKKDFTFQKGTLDQPKLDNPKILVVFSHTKGSLSKSKTFQSIQSQTYKNFEIITDELSKERIKQHQNTLVYYLKDGPVLDTTFLEKLVYEYNGEDVICCGFGAFRSNRNHSLFYRSLFPQIEVKNNSTLLSTTHSYMILFNKEFLLSNFEEIQKKQQVKVNNYKMYKMDLLSFTIKEYMDEHLQEYKNEKIFLYGASTHTLDLLDLTNLKELNICGILDKDIRKMNTQINGYEVFHTSQLATLSFDKILISSASYESEIYYELSKEISKDDIIRIYGF